MVNFNLIISLCMGLFNKLTLIVLICVSLVVNKYGLCQYVGVFTVFTFTNADPKDQWDLKISAFPGWDGHLGLWWIPCGCQSSDIVIVLNGLHLELAVGWGLLTPLETDAFRWHNSLFSPLNMCPVNAYNSKPDYHSLWIHNVNSSAITKV